MLGQPALLLTHGRGNAQGEALLAEQGIAAVARANAPDGARLGEVGDEAAVGRQVAQRVQAGHPVGRTGFEAVHGDVAHAGHDAHVGHDVGTIGDLDADFGVRRVGGAHEVGHHVHRAAAHAVFEERPDARLGVVGAHPVVGRASVLGVLRADKGQVLGAGDVLRVGAMQETVGQLVLIQANEGAVGEHVID